MPDEVLVDVGDVVDVVVNVVVTASHGVHKKLHVVGFSLTGYTQVIIPLISLRHVAT